MCLEPAHIGGRLPDELVATFVGRRRHVGDGVPLWWHDEDVLVGDEAARNECRYGETAKNPRTAGVVLNMVVCVKTRQVV